MVTLGWPWSILRQVDLFYGKVNPGPLCFCMGKKVKQWKFQKLLLSIISKMVVAVNKMSTCTYINIKGQGHSLTLDQGHSDSTFLNFFSWETARPIEAKLHVALS